MRPIPLSILFASLLAGCRSPGSGTEGRRDSVDTEDSGWCYGENPQPQERTSTYPIPGPEYLAALAGAETLSEEACHAFCRSEHWAYPELVLEIYECADQATPETGGGEVTCRYLEDAFCEGRAHQDVARQRRTSGPDLRANWLARAAHAEASSVAAFLNLAQELRGFGAPSELVRGCRRAASDEVFHARAMCKLAIAAGGKMEALVQQELQPRSLEDFAIENAVEGCVGETWAALQAGFQARAAPDGDTRAVFAAIARDETRHAELARAVHSWCLSQLSPAARARVELARQDAWARLLGQEEPGLAELGLPDAQTAGALKRGLMRSLAASEVGAV